jgi:hypothetical protein
MFKAPSGLPIEKKNSVVPKQYTCFEYIRILSNSLLSAKAATTLGVALAFMYIFSARSLSTVYTKAPVSEQFTYRSLKKLWTHDEICAIDKHRTIPVLP